MLTFCRPGTRGPGRVPGLKPRPRPSGRRRDPQWPWPESRRPGLSPSALALLILRALPPPRGPEGARESSTLACRRFWANLFTLFSSTSRFVDKFRVSPLETSLEVGGHEGCPESLSAGLCWWSSLTLPGQGPGIFRCDLEPGACCLQK